MKDITQQGYVHIERKSNGVAFVIFYHPAHNSLPSRLLQGLVEAFSRLGEEKDVQVIVLKSAEHRTFCSGASFDELTAIHDFDTALAFFKGFGSVINAMRTCPKIIVGRVHGKAVGGGVGLAAGVDYCLASKWASVRLSELAIGFGPFVIGPAVERKLGLSAFSQLALNPSEWVTAQWAKEKGLFTEAFDTEEQLDAYIDHFTEKLVAYNPAALLALKKVFWEGTEHWDTLLDERARLSGEMSLSDFSKNAIADFKAK